MANTDSGDISDGVEWSWRQDARFDTEIPETRPLSCAGNTLSLCFSGLLETTRFR